MENIIPVKVITLLTTISIILWNCQTIVGFFGIELDHYLAEELEYCGFALFILEISGVFALAMCMDFIRFYFDVIKKK